jgi:hypothetical protein
MNMTTRLPLADAIVAHSAVAAACGHHGASTFRTSSTGTVSATATSTNGAKQILDATFATS